MTPQSVSERGRPERGGHAWNCPAGDMTRYLPCTCPLNNYHQRWEDVPPEPAAQSVTEAAARAERAIAKMQACEPNGMVSVPHYCVWSDLLSRSTRDVLALAERAERAASQPSLFQIRCDLNWAIGYASTSPLDGWTEPLVEGLQSIADRLSALAAGSEDGP